MRREMSEAKLDYFFEAARFGSMRAAADRLGVAVSSVSRQIAQLERDMGVSLIERGRRTLKLTEAGALAFDYCHERVGRKEAFDSRIADLKGLRAGRIAIAIDEGFVAMGMASVIGQFMATYDRLSLEAHLAGPQESLRRVAEDDAHLGLLFNPLSDPRLSVRASIGAPLRVVACADHPLARRERLRLADLAGLRLALPDGAFDIARLLADAERREGVTLQPALQTNSLALIHALVRTGGMIAILPDFAAAAEAAAGAMVSLPLADPFLSGAVVTLVTRMGRVLPFAAGKLATALESHLSGWPRSVERRRAG